MVAVIGAQRLDPVALALGLRADRARLFERGPGGLAHPPAAAPWRASCRAGRARFPNTRSRNWGPARRTPSNVRRAMRNQYEWIIATPRSNSACTLGSQEVGKLSLPSFSSCWPKALQLSAAVIAGDKYQTLRLHGHLRAHDLGRPTQWVAAKHHSRMDACRWHQVLPFKVGIWRRLPAALGQCYTRSARMWRGCGRTSVAADPALQSSKFELLARADEVIE